MAKGDLSVGILPDFDRFEQELEQGDFSTEVQVEGEAPPGGAGGGEAAGGGMGIGQMGALIGIVAVIADVLMNLEPLVALFQEFMAIVTIFFLPFAILLFKLLQPALKALLQLLPGWMNFIEDMGVYDIADAIGGVIGDILSGYFDFFANMIDKNISKLQEAIPGVGGGKTTGRGISEAGQGLQFLMNPPAFLGKSAFDMAAGGLQNQMQTAEKNLTVNILSMLDESTASEVINQVGRWRETIMGD